MSSDVVEVLRAIRNVLLDIKGELKAVSEKLGEINDCLSDAFVEEHTPKEIIQKEAFES